jgi:hypothetical protein
MKLTHLVSTLLLLLVILAGCGQSQPAPDTSQIWQPAVHASFQWQLSEPVDLSVDAAVYDIDLFDTPANVVAALHARGRYVICYIDVGSWENWRPDAQQFPASVLGKVYTGYPDERWLDIRQVSILAPLIEARMDQCQAKGFDAIEPDNIDGYENDTGFPLTAQDQLTYNRFLAQQAHARGLSIGLKNDWDQVGDLLASFDWALSEDCFAQQQCDTLKPFIQAGKAVFDVEYTLDPSAFCPQARAMQFSALKKHLSLDAYRVACG